MLTVHFVILAICHCACLWAWVSVGLIGADAEAAGHNFVGTEQILLGLIGESTGIAAKVLKSMNVNLKDTRVEVEKIIGRGSGFVAVEIPFTPRAKRVLELSLEEARQLGARPSSCMLAAPLVLPILLMQAFGLWLQCQTIATILIAASNSPNIYHVYHEWSHA